MTHPANLSSTFALLVGLLVGLLFAPFAFAEPVGAPDLSPADLQALFKVARLTLSGQVRQISDIPPGVVTPNLIRKYEEEVSITLFRDRAPLSRYSFHGKNLLDDTFGMTFRATTMPGHLFYSFDRSDQVGIFIEFVTDRETIKPADWKKRLASLDLGVDGLRLTDPREYAAKPPAVAKSRVPPRIIPRGTSDTLMPSLAVTSELDSRDAFIFHLCERLKLYPSRRPVMPTGSILWDEKATRVSFLRTRAFISLPGQTSVQELFRVNTPPVPPDPDSLLDLATAAADCTVRRQSPDGSFLPSYHPFTGEPGRAYDFINQQIAVESLLDLYQHSNEPRYLDAARRALDAALSLTRTDNTPAGPRRFVVFGQQAELGFTALTLANLSRFAELAPDARLAKLDLPAVSLEMARFLVDMQYEDGSFRYLFQYDPKVPLHYRTLPAHADMAAWALVHFGLRSNDPAWLNHGSLAVTFLVTGREASMNWDRPPAFTWLARSLRSLCSRNPDPRFSDYLFRMADSVLSEQYPPDTKLGPDVVGAYAANVQQLVTATACKLVIVNHAANLAHLLKDDRLDRYRKSAGLAAGFLADHRFRPVNSFYLPDPDEVQGDFRAGIFRSTITLDTDAFAIQALLTFDELSRLAD